MNAPLGPWPLERTKMENRDCIVSTVLFPIHRPSWLKEMEHMGWSFMSCGASKTIPEFAERQVALQYGMMLREFREFVECRGIMATLVRRGYAHRWVRMTATPSLHCDASIGGCGFHGFLTNGVLA